MTQKPKGLMVETLSNDKYHGGAGVSATFLKTLVMKSPAHAKHDKDNPKDSDAFKRGRLIHTLLLEPHLFERDFRVLPEDAPAKPTKTQREAKAPSEKTQEALRWWSEWEQSGEGKDTLNQKEYSDALALVAAVEQATIITDDDLEVQFLPVNRTKGIVEPSFFWKENGVECKSRPDLLRVDTGILIDLKTTQDARLHPFSSAVLKYGYHIQAAMQCMGYEAVYGKEANAYIWIAIEPDAPYGVCIYQADAELLEHGKALVREGLGIYKHCVESGRWPNYDPTPKLVKLPSYMKGNDNE
jgi:hypothetical protein